MLIRNFAAAYCLTSAFVASFLVMPNAGAAAESTLRAYPYPVKAGVKNGDYSFSVPTRVNESPIVEVHQSDGRFAAILRDKDVHFKTSFSIDCGNKWQLEKDPLLSVFGNSEHVTAENLGVLSANSEYSHMTSRMTSFEPTLSSSPQHACNTIVDDRANAGLDTASLLKKGFWTKIDQAYKVGLRYSCVRTKKRKRNLFNPTRSKKLSAWQPLFVHCVGDSDYGKQFAKTSRSTSASSASHDDIKKALAKKRKPTSSKQAKRTNPKTAVDGELLYQGLINSGHEKRVVSPPKLFDDFLEYGATMTSARQMRLVDFETLRMNQRQYYVGLWQKGNGTSLFVKPLTVAKFNKLHQKNINKGLRLADFELLKINQDTRVVSLWQSGKLDEQFSPNMSAKGFKQRNATLKKTGLYPVDIEMLVNDGDIRYAALWRQSSSNPPTNDSTLLSKPAQFMPALETKQFRTTRDELVSQGKQLVDVERVVRDGKTYFAGLWVDGDGPSRLSKPRNRVQFKDFINSSKAPFVQDLEIHFQLE
ncbi:hypothetical protein [Arenicella chitinivorans]|nr:hypothetical protein [Arenicella chitinivorans]